MARRVLPLLVFLWATGPAHADEAGVVVFPFATTDEELVVYGKPVADALARGLGGQGVRAIVAKPDAGASGAALVVELRATRAKRKVRVEASLREPETGLAVASVSARPTPIANLDVAAVDLAKQLVPLVARAEAARRERHDAERAGSELTPVALPVAAPADPRPTVVVYRPEGVVAGGTVSVREVATMAIVELLSALGYRSIISSSVGVVRPEVAAASARSAGARATLMLYVDGVDFSWDGVLLARGKLRVIAVGPDGRILLNRALETDTLVGGRGDRHDALLRFVVRQAMDMSRRDLAMALR